jgi:hypothetical protein
MAAQTLLSCWSEFSLQPDEQEHGDVHLIMRVALPLARNQCNTSNKNELYVKTLGSAVILMGTRDSHRAISGRIH